MLIDASHREETRVVVLRGNRIEEFDFEAQERRQLRGNIYLAKVTRVEPSLQAAFIDYGGNRHGFLAFSEIHPDYYQIPAADRQALLDQEAQDAVADAATDDRDRVVAETSEITETFDTSTEDDKSSDTQTPQEDGVEAVAEEKPKKRRRRSRRKPKTETTTEESNEDGNTQVEASSNETAANEDAASSDSSVEEAPQDDTDNGTTTMAAMVEMDSISEPAPESDESDNDDASSETASEEVAEEKPKKRRTTRRTTRKKKTEIEASLEEATTEEVGVKEETASEDTSKETAEEKPKKRTTRRRKKKTDDEVVEAKATEAESESAAEVGTETSDTPVSGEKSEADAKDTDASDADKAGEDVSTDIPKPARKRSRRGRKSKSAPTTAETDSDDNDTSVESAGQEDAMEEVPVRRKSRRQYKIQEVIRRRQVLLVQVVKEERGNKGAALTTYLSLAGRYSVLMPNTARGGGISRKITNASDRKRLKEIANGLDVPAGMGVILRTAGASRTDVEINRDFEYLMRLWENVRNLTLESSAPYLVYEEGSLIKRSIRDLFNKDIGEVIVSGEDGFKEAQQFMQMLEPSQTKNVKLYRGEAPILSRYGVESQLDKMLATQVTLKSGGYLVINQTEALVAVDVNSGRSTREHSIEATAVQTNLEAAEEVARQLKLRDLAGLVVIDFIDMEEKRNNRAVEKRMKECLKNDRARIQVGHISHFGLMEMSRQRMRASVLESTMEVCPHCQGIGHVRSPSSYSIHIMRAIEDHLNRNSRNDLTLKVARNAALYILNHHRSALNELEERFGVKIIVEIDTSVEGQSHTIEKGALSTTEPKQRAVVNPMDFGEETIVDGSEPAAATPPTDASPADASPALAPTSSEDDEENGNKKRRRRRRGGRGRGRDKDQTEEQNNSQETVDNATAESAEKATEADVSEVKATAEAAVEATVDTPSETVDEAPAKPKLGRRKKAPIVEKAAVDDTTAKAETVEAKEEPPRKPRRSTGRPGRKAKTDESVTEATTETSIEATSTEVVVEKTDVKEATSADTKETSPKKTKRSTGRPGRKSKAVKTEESTAEPEKVETEATEKAEVSAEPTVETDEKPAKPKKRTKGRVKAEAIEDDSSSEDAGDKKKKKSWIKGFFS